MKRYDLSPAMRMKLAVHHRVVQGAIAILANRRFEIDVKLPEGISKFEGGVIVNHCEIAIYKTCASDDWKRVAEPTREEIAVVEAIAEVEALWNIGGASALTRFQAIRFGDPLRSMLDVR